jgi:hypothetical protein
MLADTLGIAVLMRQRKARIPKAKVIGLIPVRE